MTSTAAALSVGRLRDRFGLFPVIRAGFVLFVAGFGLAAGVPALWAVCGASLLYGAGDGLLISTLQDTVAGVAPPGARGTVIATWVGFARFGQTVGPLAVGVGLDAAGARPVFAAGAALATLLVLAQRPMLAAAGDPQAATKLETAMQG